MDITGILLEPKRFSIHDGPGIRTVLFFKGCVLKCLWCHNPESISRRPQLGYYAHKCIECADCRDVCPMGAHDFSGGKHIFDHNRCKACGQCEPLCPGGALKLYGKVCTVKDAAASALQDLTFYQRSGGGVTLSGGEPLMQLDFAESLLKELKKYNLHTALDTCACVDSSAFARVLPFTDMFLVDFKHAVSYEHKKHTGLGNELVCQNLQWLSDRGARIEIRIPLIPGCNDSYENMEKTAGFLSKLCIESVRLLPYHSLARSKYRAINMPDTMPDVPTPEYDQLTEFAGILQKSGLTVKAI